MTDHQTYIIPLDDIDLSRILKTWTWLTGEQKTVIALTKLGDALLKDDNDKLFFLNTGVGDLTLISERYLDFISGNLSSEIYEEVLLPKLVDELDKSEKALKAKQVYAFYKLPLIGGTYDKANIYALDLYKHYNLTGEIHLQLKDLPNGTAVEFEVK
jgi:hypothetical protein